MTEQPAPVGRVPAPDLDITDHDILVAIINLVGNLAEKLTGERLTLVVSDRHGNSVGIFPNPCAVRWVKAEEASRPAVQRESHHTPSAP